MIINRNIKVKLADNANRKEAVQKALNDLGEALGLDDASTLYVYEVKPYERNLPVSKAIRNYVDIDKMYNSNSFQFHPETAMESAKIFELTNELNSIFQKRRKINTKDFKARAAKKAARTKEVVEDSGNVNE